MLYNFFDIDFETKSELDITVVGAHKYAMHPSTEILIMGYSFNEVDVYDYDIYFSKSKQLDKITSRVEKKLRQGYKLRAFNSMFEYLIWKYVGVRQLGLPKLKISQTYCVMAESCAMGFPASLENAAKSLDLVDQKDSSGSALISFFCKPIKKGGTEFRSPLDHKEKFINFKHYCRQDVTVQIGISTCCKKLTPYQYKTFLLTEKMNLRGLPIDVPMVKGALILDSVVKEKANATISKLTNGVVSKATQTAVITKWLNANGCEIPNMQAATIDRWLRTLKPKSHAYKILNARVEGSKSSTAKYIKALTYITDNGLVHDFIKYHVAHTGRWGGRGLQIQNFSKPDKTYTSKLSQDRICELIASTSSRRLEHNCSSIGEALKAVTRGMICAPEGKKFVSADFAQIEARIVMWLSNDYTGLADFAGKGLIYENMASNIFDMPVRKILKPSFERDVGKETILGCGFGMGHKKFYARCVEDRGLDIKESIAIKAVKGFRERYPKVKKSWTECEQKAILAINTPGSSFEACEGKLTFVMEGDNLSLFLPSGRRLTYPTPCVKYEVNDWGQMGHNVYYYTWNQKTKGNKWVPHSIWGGIFFQNAVQAIATDIMNNGMIIAERANYHSLFTVHDESVSLVEDSPRFSYPMYEKLLSNYLPTWAHGLNIIAEGWEGKRYRK